MLEPAASGLRSRRLLAGLAALGLLAYGAVLVRHTAWSIGAADSSGYYNHARALAAGEIARPIRALAALELDDVPVLTVVPLGFVLGRQDGTMVPSYPPGYPLHMAAFAALLGWEVGPFLVNPAFALLGVVAFFALARELGLTPLESGSAALVLALHPVYVFMALQAMSDTTATTWAILAVLLALRARRSPGWALGAGAAFAVGCLVRPTNALVLVPVVLALPWRPGVLLRFALAGLPGLAFLLAFNAAAYGHPLHTGYGEVGREFSLAFFPERWRHYTHWLGVTFTPVLPLAWLGVAASRETRGRDRLMLLAWFAVFLAFFGTYRFHEDWWYLRFLMPAFPALVAGAVLAARPVWRALELRLHVPGRSLRSANLLPALALVLVASREVATWDRQEVFAIAGYEGDYRRACRLAEERLPPGAMVLSKLTSGALEAYTSFPQLRFDTMDPKTARRLLRRSLRRGRPWYALVHEAERPEFERSGLGSWRRVDSAGLIDLLELDPESLLGPLPAPGKNVSSRGGKPAAGSPAAGASP